MLHEAMQEAREAIRSDYTFDVSDEGEDAPDILAEDDDGPVSWRMPEFSPDDALRVLGEMGDGGTFTMRDIEQ